MGVRRHSRRWALAALLALGAEATAQSPADSVVQQLREQGYVEFEVSQTLLRRIRVVAYAPDGEWREIVFNPATGEILRDYREAADGGRLPMLLDPSDLQDGPRPSPSGSSDDDDVPHHDDDDVDDDEDDDDDDQPSPGGDEDDEDDRDEEDDEDDEDDGDED